MGWASIVEYNGLCFFPLNNHHSRPHNHIAQWLWRLFYTADELDDSIGNSRSEIERVIKGSECTKQPKPSAWFKACDELTASTKSFLTLKDYTKNDIIKLIKDAFELDPSTRKPSKSVLKVLKECARASSIEIKFR